MRLKAKENSLLLQHVEILTLLFLTSYRELSNCRYAQSQRRLGFYWFNHKDLVKAADCFDKAVKLNPMFANIWFTLGKRLLHAAPSVYFKGVERES